MKSDNFNRQQGTTIKCVYCKLIFKDFYRQKTIPERVCPKCNNQREIFIASRMLDKESANNKLIGELIDFFTNKGSDLTKWKKANEEASNSLKDQLYSLIQEIFIYQFDLMSALIELYKGMNEDLI